MTAHAPQPQPDAAAAALTKVLAVDDSALVHSMYDMILRRYPGCKVIHATNGREALDLLDGHHDIQLLLVDINMPIMTGLEFMAEYRRKHSGGPPAIIVSTMGKEEDARRGLEAGAAAYLTKPFQPNDLYSLIEKVLGVRPPVPR